MRVRLLPVALLAAFLFALPVSLPAPVLTGSLETARSQTPASYDVDPIGPPATEGALVLREFTLEESAQRAGLVVVGRVQSQTSRSVPGSIVTDITVQVEKQIKGPEPAQTTVTFTTQGGSVGQRRLYVGGQPNFVNGERVLLFLRSATDLQLVQMYTSRYTLAGSQAVQPEDGIRTLPISDVEVRLSRVIGRPVAIGATANSTPSSAPFTTFCVPWTTGQLPVPHFVNDGSAVGSPPAGNGAATGIAHFNVIYQAFAMWQSLTDSAVAFSIGGATTNNGQNHGDYENTIAWADINTVPGGGSGVIGLNYCQVDFGTGRHDSDTLISNNGAWTWDSFPDDGITANTISVKALMGHEFGHGLGLDHSDATCSGPGSSTPIMCASLIIGQDKFIQADDQAGAANRYPLSGAAPGAPSSLSATGGSGTATLNWTAGSGSKFAYQIDRATPDCNATFRPVNTVAGTATSYVDSNYGLGLPAASFCYRVKALGQGGDSGYSNTATSGAPNPPPAGCTGTTNSLWNSAATPATTAYPDTGSYEFGLKFFSDVTGLVCGVKFYKGAGNSGPHIGKLWSTAGAQLASATFVNETATGWQTVYFSNAVPVTAGTTYIVSYSDPTGRFSWDPNYFASSEFFNAPLHAPSHPASGGNAIFATGAGNFPTGANGSNFWVDVVFASTTTPPPPGCTGTTNSLWNDSTVPATTAHPDTGSYEFGLRFFADTGGVACGVRFYKGVGNNGPHTGRLWTTSGVQLASVVFSGETASGWQQAYFSTAVTLTPGTMYIVSYSDPTGRFSWNANYFSSVGFDNAPLHAPSHPASGGNALFAIGAGNFPTNANGSNYWVDIVYAPTSNPAPPGCTGTNKTLWSSAVTPGTPSFPDTGSYEFGVKWRSDVNGLVCGVRFYKGTGNTGTHIGKLWATNGTLLAQALFTSETATGWQTVYFSSAVAVTGGTTYLVSYSDPNGRFSWDGNYFASTGVDNAPLHAPSSPSSGGNAVWAIGAGNFPTNSNGANYWVDVVFATSSNPPPPGCADPTSSLWTPATTPSTTAHPDTGSYEFGVRVWTDTPGVACGVRFYKGIGNNGPHTGKLWTATGQLLASAAFADETSSGWQTVYFSTAVSLTPGTMYIVSYSDPTGRFAWNGNYFSSSGVDSPPLHSPSLPASGGNGLWAIGAGNFPTNSNGSNYWVDIVFK